MSAISHKRFRQALAGLSFVIAFVLHTEQILSDETPEQQLQPNELGTIMVLMYHNIRAPEAEWSRTPQNFEKDLAVLYERNYRPISLEDFVGGQIDIPQGTTPVVITFDDATLGQFKITVQDGEKKPAPQCAVGILERFHDKHPDFPLEATFFVNGRNPFKEPAEVAKKLNYIVSRGMDLGNHTAEHQNLRLAENASPEKIQSAVGRQANYLERMLLDHPNYKVRTFALCFGQRPQNSFLLKYLANGIADGKPYENIAVLNVGSSPAYSPIDIRFNPLSIPRVRASEIQAAGVGLYARLNHYAKHPEDRYVSDGSLDVVTIPAASRKFLNENRLWERKLVVY